MEVETTVFKVIWLKARVFGYVLVCWNVALLLHGSLALAQVTKLTEKTAFSNPLVLHFEDLQLTSEASQVYSNLGVTFVGEADSTPMVQLEVLIPSLPPSVDWVLRNEPATGSSANRALIVRFERPVRRVGFTLGNGTANTVAEIQAFTAKGEFLGKIQQIGAETIRGPLIGPPSGPFVGLETSHPSGISSVVLDYGTDPAAEQISDIRVEFLSPRNFKVYLVAGSPGGPTIINTVFQILLNVIDHGMDIQEAVDAPRIHHQWMPDELAAERDGIVRDVELDLLARGHKIVWKERIGDAHCILIDPKTGVRLGAADPRADGRAVGY